MRYKQDLAEFLPIADAARLIQERAGISEDEAREDIVHVLQDYAVRFLLYDVRKDGRHLRKDVHGDVIRQLRPERIDWSRSLVRGGSVYVPYTVEIEVSRSDLCRRWPDSREVPPGSGDAKDAATVGRPSQREKIEEAYAELEKENEINFDGSKTAIYEPIRKKVRKILGKKPSAAVPGLGDEAIRLAITPLFARDKMARQQSQKSSQKL